MATTFTLISAVTVGAGGAASIDFTSIPSTYTDLVLDVSTRSVSTDYWVGLRFNGSTTSYTGKYLYGSGSAASSGSNVASSYTMLQPPNSYTSGTFSNTQIYIPNYAGSTNKSYSVDSVAENNATDGLMTLQANLWSNTAAINQLTIISLTPQNLTQYSTAYLYGVKNA